MDAALTKNRLLTEFVSGRCWSNVFELSWPSLTRRKLAHRLCRAYQTTGAADSKGWSETTELVLNLDLYDGNNPYVLALGMAVDKALRQDIVGAYVHGSVATREEIAFSDLDALVILKTEVFESPDRLIRVGKALNRLCRYMYRFDPLQHHGWFVLTASDLAAFDEAYLPVAVLQNSRRLSVGSSSTLRVSVSNPGRQSNDVIKSLCRVIRDRLERRRYPTNLFQLKSALSRFMLLPSLYVQARDGTGVWKGDSFALARPDFSVEEWRVMTKITEIRSCWKYEIGPLRTWLMTRTSPRFQILRKKWFAPRIPKALVPQVGPALFREIVSFTKVLEIRLSQVRSVEKRGV